MLRGRNVALADTIVSRSEPYFSCSPDGIIDSQTNLEINYTQIQLAMYCTGAKLCKFYVWCFDPKK